MLLVSSVFVMASKNLLFCFGQGHVYNKMPFLTECDLPCLMTSDKDFLGKGNIDKFDALFFRQFEVNTDDRGEKIFLKF